MAEELRQHTEAVRLLECGTASLNFVFRHSDRAGVDTKAQWMLALERVQTHLTLSIAVCVCVCLDARFLQ